MSTIAEALRPWAVDAVEFPRLASEHEQLRFLVRYAVLAPSTHNTQPWLFAILPGTIEVLPDETRWLHVCDPDRRELHISLGCALENLLVAARHFGYVTSVEYPLDGEAAAIVRLERRRRLDVEVGDTELFDALRMRKTSHREFADREVPRAAVSRLLHCCLEDDVALYLTADPATKRTVNDLVVLADAMLFSDPAWRDELAHWIAEGAFGTPWLLGKLAQFALHHLDMGGSTGRRDAARVQSAPLLGVIGSRRNDRASQVRVGQVFERVYLVAASLGLALQPLSQVLEVPSTKAALASALPLQGFLPQQTFRVGYAEPEPDHTPRRPLQEVLVT